MLLTLIAGGTAAAPPPQAAPALSVTGGWIHPAPAGQYETWAFASIRNDGPADAIVEVRSPDAASVVLRAGTMTDAGRRVRSVASIPVPPHGEQNLSADSWFFAFIELRRALLPGQTLTATIRFASGVSLPAEFRVIAAEGDPADSGN
ncbi:MAG TPA: copper chaperone PCu(A)C [Steroidobacteraceae bacterium]|nr:copper chaperone PCu(A)C [Steroidobacteraceae bacterium]